MTQAIRIPPEQLAPSTLRGLVEEFVSRDGTDYGDREISLTVRVDQVLKQLRSGQVVIVFDPESQSCNLFNRDQLPEEITMGEVM